MANAHTANMVCRRSRTGASFSLPTNENRFRPPSAVAARLENTEGCDPDGVMAAYENVGGPPRGDWAKGLCNFWETLGGIKSFGMACCWPVCGPCLYSKISARSSLPGTSWEKLGDSPFKQWFRITVSPGDFLPGHFCAREKRVGWKTHQCVLLTVAASVARIPAVNPRAGLLVRVVG